MLSPFEQYLLLQAFLLLPLIGIALRFGGMRRLQTLLARRVPSPAAANLNSESLIERARMTAWIVSAASGHGLYRAHCLPQSLTLWWLLQRQDIASDLRIGVRKPDGRFQAHAWVEVDGHTLDQAVQGQEPFKPFNRSMMPLRMKSEVYPESTRI